MKIEFRVSLTTEEEPILREETPTSMTRGQGFNPKFSTVVHHGGNWDRDPDVFSFG